MLIAVLIAAAQAASPPPATVSGRVLSVSGTPVARARVEVDARPGEPEEAMAADAGTPAKSLARAETGRDGSFSIRVPPGRVRIAVEAAGMARQEIEDDLSDGESDELPPFHLRASAAYSGIVRDAGGRPVAGALVRIAGNRDPDSAIETSEVRTDRDGRFRMEAATEASSIDARARSMAPATREIDPKKDISGRLELKLAAGGVISGVVRNRDGSPADGALVSSSGHAVTCGSEGKYRLVGAAAGRDLVTALRGRLVGSLTVNAAAGKEVQADLTLQPAATIEGSVVDAKTRNPIAGVALAAGSSTTATGRKGAFSIAGLSSGTYLLVARKLGYVSAPERTIKLAAGETRSSPVALAPAAKLSGRVVGDDGKPVAGARVRPEVRAGRGRRMFRFPPGPSVPGSAAVTDARGTFSLWAEGGAEPIKLVARAENFAEGSTGGVKAAPGEQKAGLTIRLARGVAASGAVVNEQGNAIAGAEVRIKREARTARGIGRFFFQREDRDDSSPKTTTNARGNYQFAHLTAGKYSVTAEARSFARETAPNVVVKAGSATTIPAITLHPAASIDGIIVDSAGAPVIGASVTGSSESDDEETQSDAVGHFQLTGFSPGTAVSLRVTSDSHAPASKRTTAPASSLRIQLAAFGVLRGRVTDAASGAAISVFAIGRSRGDQRVFAFGPGTAGGANEIQSPDGSYELPNIPPGTWTFTSSAEGHQTQTLSGIEVKEGEATEHVDFEMKTGAHLSGTVVDAAAGSPIPNATVECAPPGAAAGPFGRGGLGAQGLSSVTDANGRFAFDNLPAGRITVSAQEDSHVPAEITVDPAEQSNVVVQLEGGGSISGTVVDSDGKTPVPGAEVGLQPQGEGERAFAPLGSTMADGSGGFLFDHLSAGRYSVAASSGERASAAVEVIVNAGQPATGVVVRLAGGAHVTGSITGLSAGDDPNVRINAFEAGGFRASASADATGTFSIDGVPTGTLQVSASLAQGTGSRSARSSVEIADGQTEASVEVDFPKDGALHGRVTRGGIPVTEAFVAASPSPGSAATAGGNGQTESDGSYQISGLDDAGYDVRVRNPETGATARRRVEVSGDTALDIDLPVLAVSGSVVEAGSNEPVDGVAVRLDSGDETSPFAMKRATSDSLGKFLISDVDAADYQLNAQKQGWQTATQSLSVTDDVAGVSISMTRAEGITLVVSDGMIGIPLSGYHATVFTPEGGIAFDGSLTADQTGRSEIPQLSPGVYAFYLFAQGYATFVAPEISIPSPPLTVSVTPGGSLVIRADSPARGSAARLITASGLAYLRFSFNLTGLFSLQPATTFDHVAPGSYTLSVQLPDGEKSYAVTIVEGQPTALNVP